jgi:predicted Zn-dependent protease
VLGALATGGGAPGDPVLADWRQRLALGTAALTVLAVGTPAYLASAAVPRKDALADLDTAVRLNPLAAEPLLTRSTILPSDAQPRAAVEAARGATERAPRNWIAWLVLAQARRASGDGAGWRAALERAGALNARRVPEFARID